MKWNSKNNYLLLLLAPVCLLITASLQKCLGSNCTCILFQMQLFACLIFFSLNLCLHFLVLFLFCHPYLISSLFWNWFLETNWLSNYIGWITFLSKHLDKLEKNLLKKRIMILSAHICMSPYVYFQGIFSII